jgi:succinate-semialdehyde dehydrogenase/glutarate-semialdehyde dehydrogenase
MPPDTIERPTLALKDPSLLRQQCHVDGRWVGADDGGSMPVVDPATGGPVGTAPVFRAVETKRAIDAANRAWPAWRARTAKERSAILRKWHDLMLANVDDLALILTTEQGKPLAEAKGEVTIGAAYVEWFAEEAKRVYHTVELPVLDDHAEGVARARGRVHGRHQARRSDAVLGVGARRARRARRLSTRRAQRDHR